MSPDLFSYRARHTCRPLIMKLVAPLPAALPRSGAAGWGPKAAGEADQAYSGLILSVWMPYLAIASTTLATGTLPSSLKALSAATTMK